MTTRNQIRIVGGAWRGRKLAFPDSTGLRPTPDRVRETLFNWLAPVVGGSRCLDLFAGSGALGFEAASRGAAEVVMVERDAAVAKNLREQQQRLNAAQIQVVQADALQFLAGAPRPFDIVLLDPPFGQNLLQQVLATLARGWLAPRAWIYMEAERGLDGGALSGWLPESFELYRSKATGQVGYHLARRV
ncbi:MAG TPA: 16S rRNA (guanine(966)-N(2))-methyltransferase RsmD [Gammaproteobacteria bacterium]